MLGLIIIVIIVSNVFLWNFSMNQLDWERMKEDINVTDVSRVNSSSWFVAQNEYSVVTGNQVNGTFVDTQAIDEGRWETFREGQPPTAPSTVGTGTSGAATQYPCQRKAFHANGLFWVFYSDGTNLVYRTSGDGSAWSTAMIVRTSSNGYYFSIWFDGANVHYACTRGVANEALIYRQGTPSGNGTVTWSADEQQAVSAVPTAYSYPYLSVDSNGCPFITYLFNNYPYVTKSSLNNGTWQTAPGFPYQLQASSSGSWRSSILPLTAGKAYVLYNNRYTTYGRLWNGSNWGTEETVTTTDIQAPEYFSVATQDDDVHFAFLSISPYNITYKKRTYGVGWGTEVPVQSSTTSSSAPVLSVDTASKDVYVFWAGSPTPNCVYYKKQSAGVWDASPTIWIEGQGTQTLGAGNDLDEDFYGSVWKSQSFISMQADMLTRVEVYVKRGAGSASVSIKVNIYLADDDSKPTGLSLGSGTITSFSGTTYGWRACTFSTPLYVSGSTKYCIVLSAPTGSATQYYDWAVDSTSPPYSDGNLAYSSDNGSTWTSDATKDALFRAYFDSTLYGNDRLNSYLKDAEGILGVTYVTRTTSPYTIKHEYLSLTQPLWALDLNGIFKVDALAYPSTCIQTIETQITFRASDPGEKWYIEAYNWTSMLYSINGFNVTGGYTPTTNWDQYSVNFTVEWKSYMSDDGTVKLRFHDNGRDINQTSVDIDFIGVRVAINGANFTFQNKGSATCHLVALWLDNSTLHARYGLDIFINVGDTTSYLRSDIKLPDKPFVVKVVSEKGNIAVYSEN